MLLAWNAILPYKKEFLHDEKGFFLPKEEIIKALQSAYIFYTLKKEKSIEHKAHKLINEHKGSLKELVQKIQDLVLQKHQFNITLEDRIYLPKEGINKVLIKVYDPENKRFSHTFTAQIFKGIIPLQIENIAPYKAALDSFSRALAEFEHKKLKESSLEKIVIEIQNQIANEWEYTLRLGNWDDGKRDFFYFWRFKELRKKLFENESIFLDKVYFIPEFGELCGWSEYR